MSTSITGHRGASAAVLVVGGGALAVASWLACTSAVVLRRR